MVRVVPTPWWQSDEIVLAIEFKTLDVRLYDSLVFGVCLDIIDVKTRLVILLSALDNAFVLYFKVLDILWDISVLTVLSIAISVIGNRFYMSFWSFASSLFQHFVDHLSLEFLTNLKQFIHILPVNLTPVVDEHFIFFQISFVTGK